MKTRDNDNGMDIPLAENNPSQVSGQSSPPSARALTLNYGQVEALVPIWNRRAQWGFRILACLHVISWCPFLSTSKPIYLFLNIPIYAATYLSMYLLFGAAARLNLLTKTLLALAVCYTLLYIVLTFQYMPFSSFGKPWYDIQSFIYDCSYWGCNITWTYVSWCLIKTRTTSTIASSRTKDIISNHLRPNTSIFNSIGCILFMATGAVSLVNSAWAGNTWLNVLWKSLGELPTILEFWVLAMLAARGRFILILAVIALLNGLNLWELFFFDYDPSITDTYVLPVLGNTMSTVAAMCLAICWLHSLSARRALITPVLRIHDGTE